MDLNWETTSLPSGDIVAPIGALVLVSSLLLINGVRVRGGGFFRSSSSLQIQPLLSSPLLVTNAVEPWRAMPKKFPSPWRESSPGRIGEEKLGMSAAARALSLGRGSGPTV